MSTGPKLTSLKSPTVLLSLKPTLTDKITNKNIVSVIKVMTVEVITELAKKEAMLTMSELDNKLTELKYLNFRILECILYVRVNQGCSLSDAKKIVVNSAAWIDEKDQFMSHQREQMEEFLDAAKDDIQEIEQTFYPDKTKIQVRFKPKN